jgi:hypothetical protein
LTPCGGGTCHPYTYACICSLACMCLHVDVSYLSHAMVVDGAHSCDVQSCWGRRNGPASSASNHHCVSSAWTGGTCHPSVCLHVCACMCGRDVSHGMRWLLMGLAAAMCRAAGGAAMAPRAVPQTITVSLTHARVVLATRAEHACRAQIMSVMQCMRKKKCTLM